MEDTVPGGEVGADEGGAVDRAGGDGEGRSVEGGEGGFGGEEVGGGAGAFEAVPAEEGLDGGGGAEEALTLALAEGGEGRVGGGEEGAGLVALEGGGEAVAIEGGEELGEAALFGEGGGEVAGDRRGLGLGLGLGLRFGRDDDGGDDRRLRRELGEGAVAVRRRGGAGEEEEGEEAGEGGHERAGTLARIGARRRGEALKRRDRPQRGASTLGSRSARVARSHAGLSDPAAPRSSQRRRPCALLGDEAEGSKGGQGGYDGGMADEQGSGGVLALLMATPLALWSGCVEEVTCVARGSRIATPRGWVAVEALAVGDPIYAVDLAAGALVATTVASVRRGRRECVGLAVEGGDEVVLTPDHPVHAPALGGFVEAGRVALAQVREVSVIAGALGEGRVARRRVEARRVDAGVHEVFDVGVASEHHTFVADGLVVHNKVSCGSDDCLSTTEAPGTTAGSSTAGSSTGESSTGESTGEGASFACTAELACSLAAEYCALVYPGVPGEMSASCEPLPAACVREPTCACLAAAEVEGECAVAPEGGLVVSIYGR